MNKKTSVGVPVLLAAVLGLSACVPTTELESTQPTTQEQAVEAGETSGGESATDDGAQATDEGAEATDEPATESENSGETSTETDSDDIAQGADDAMQEEEEASTESVNDSEPEPETAEESETNDQAVVDNTPTKIEAPQCFKDKVNDRGEIKFASGASSGTVNQSVLRDEADLYRFDANEGQKWALTLTSLENNAIFNLYAPTTGSITTQNDLGGLNGVLEESGTYEICVLSSARNATYELVLTIDG